MRDAARHADGAAVLLRAGQPVGKAVVGGDVIELRGRLVVPGAPGLRAVDGHDRALVAGDGDARGIVGRDPHLVIVVAAGRRLDRRAPGAPAVGRLVDAGVGHVDDVGVLRIDGDLGEVPAAPPDARVRRHLHERRAGVVRPEEAAFLGVGDHVDRVADWSARSRSPCGRDLRPAGRSSAGVHVVPPSVDL